MSIYNDNSLKRLEMQILDLILEENFSLAILECEELLRISFENNDLFFQATGYGTLGYIFYELKNYNKAIYLLQKAISTSQAGNRSFIDSGHLAMCYSKTNQLDKALNYVNIAIKASRRQNHSGGMHDWINMKANILYKMKNYRKALKWSNAAIRIARKLSKNSKNDFFYYQPYLTRLEILIKLDKENQTRILIEKLKNFFSQIEYPVLHIKRDKQKFEEIMHKFKHHHKRY